MAVLTEMSVAMVTVVSARVECTGYCTGECLLSLGRHHIQHGAVLNGQVTAFLDAFYHVLQDDTGPFASAVQIDTY